MAEERELTPYELEKRNQVLRAKEIVKKHYRQPLAVVQFLLDDNPKYLMRRVIERAEVYFEQHGRTPIVKQETTKNIKHDMYSVDYYFFANCLSWFAYDAFKGKSEELADAIRTVIWSDFGDGSDYIHKAFLINIFDSLGILFSSLNKKWIYSLQRYKQLHNGDRFIISSVTINGKYIDNLEGVLKDKLLKIASQSNYVLEERGQKVWTSRPAGYGDRNFFTFRSEDY